jgi:endoglycosylceramidase
MTRASICLVATSLLFGCSSGSVGAKRGSTAPCSEPPTSGAPFGVHCGQLVDAKGRVVFLRGVNARVDGVFDVSFDDGRQPLEAIPVFDATDAGRMRDFGFDALRLPVNWSGVEPSADGGFDEAYLDRVAQAVDDAASAGLVVLLDLHQDAYSKEIGEDGAPLWAIQPPPTKLLGGPLTDLGDRRLSQQVTDAFSTFFGASAEGTVLRERFVTMAEHVIDRFKDDPSVVGLEIFNEPQADDAGIKRLNDAAYARIRAAAPEKLYLFEPPVTRNLTDKASLPSTPLGPMSAYAPHVYTYAFTSVPAKLTKENLRRSNDNARREADAWHAPLVITEWGFDPGLAVAGDYITWQSELQEEYGASSFFWLWKEESQGSWGCFDHDAASGSWTARGALQKALARVRPARVAGWPESFGFDRAQGNFELKFRADPGVSAPHLIAVAPLLGKPTSVSCDGAAAGYSVGEYGLVSVQCGQGSSSDHVLDVSVKPMP